jgi:hypothetical protein
MFLITTDCSKHDQQAITTLNVKLISKTFSTSHHIFFTFYDDTGSEDDPEWSKHVA